MPKKTETDIEVFPGEKLAVIEEYNDGPGTYQEEGEVRSTTIGKTKLDSERRALYVKKATREIIVPERGMDI
ncbi:RNA-binding protein, partial [Candidatus Bathyarchaeota archaeon]|nr:RNA-binding protein [Candidatus Bathyarchaeota archaeon]